MNMTTVESETLLAPDRREVPAAKPKTDRKKNVAADRLIDHYYQLLCIATGSSDIEQFFVRMLHHCGSTDPQIASVLGLKHLPAALESGDGLNDFGTPLTIPAELQNAVAPFTREVLERQAQLQEITVTTRRLHQNAQMKMLDEADAALRHGMRASGRDRQEDLRDSLRLFRTVLEDPVSGRDYYAWFHIGWILWHLEGNFAEAEEAFYQAARLSAPAGDLLHFFSLRHLAYMEARQEKYGAACATVSKAVNLQSDDGGILYDAARYLARDGRPDTALTYMDRCLNSNPMFLVCALSEPDFLETGLESRVRDLLIQKQQQLVETLQTEVARWRRALSAVREAEGQSEVSMVLPTEVSEEAYAQIAKTPFAGADFFTLQSLTQDVVGNGEKAVVAGRSVLEDALSQIDSELEKYQKQIDHIKKDYELWRGTVKWIEREAKEAGFSLQPGGPLEDMRLRMQKKLDRVRDARANYEQSKDNLAQAVKSVKDNIPSLEKSAQAAKERREKITAAQNWLAAQSI
ncbi:MAG: hypothetical protein OHK0029_14150 [Armatimonadaceae bacterium]